MKLVFKASTPETTFITNHNFYSNYSIYDGKIKIIKLSTC